MTKYNKNDCLFDKNNYKISWDKMLPSAKEGNKQWIYFDSDPNPDTQHIDVISCLGLGCNNIDCTLINNLLAVLLKNNIISTRTFGIVVRLRILEKDSQILFKNKKTEKILPYLLPPNIKSNFFSNGTCMHRCRVVELFNKSPSNNISISIFIDIVRDTSQELKSFYNGIHDKWNLIPHQMISTFQLVANKID